MATFFPYANKKFIKRYVIHKNFSFQRALKPYEILLWSSPKLENWVFLYLWSSVWAKWNYTNRHFDKQKPLQRNKEFRVFKFSRQTSGWALWRHAYITSSKMVLQFYIFSLFVFASFSFPTGGSHRQKASRCSNMTSIRPTFPNPNMECPPAASVPVISSHFQMSVSHWDLPSNNLTSDDTWKVQLYIS